MQDEFTLALIKTGPHDRGQVDAIMTHITIAGLRVAVTAIFGTHLINKRRDIKLFEQLYAEHADRPYYDNLIASVAPISTALVLHGESAISRWRTLMGPTDPEKARVARSFSLRARFSGNAGIMADNAVHGSDSPESAAREIAIFFPVFAAEMAVAFDGTAACAIAKAARDQAADADESPA